MVNMEKSQLDPKQVFDIIGYQFDLKEGKVRPTLERWQNLNAKIQKLLSRGLAADVPEMVINSYIKAT